MKAFVTKPAPDFTAQAVIKGQFKEIKLSDYRSKYVLLFFYPLDFTFVNSPSWSPSLICVICVICG